jgi:hypothetical protein
MRMELLTETAQLNSQCLDHSLRAELWSVIISRTALGLNSAVCRLLAQTGCL